MAQGSLSLLDVLRLIFTAAKGGCCLEREGGY